MLEFDICLQRQEKVEACRLLLAPQQQQQDAFRHPQMFYHPEPFT